MSMAVLATTQIRENTIAMKRILCACTSSASFSFQWLQLMTSWYITEYEYASIAIEL